jgi:hypothetical protein
MWQHVYSVAPEVEIVTSSMVYHEAPSEFEPADIVRI